MDHTMSVCEAGNYSPDTNFALQFQVRMAKKVSSTKFGRQK